ncbi:MAG: hypothetical protein ACRD2I_25165 [Vicinamibacterales bacterium]
MIYSSSFPDLPIPEIALVEIVFGNGGSLASKPALINAVTGRAVSYV